MIQKINKSFRIPTIGKTNQTMQKEDQSTNHTSDAIQQNVSDVVTNISKGAKSGIKYYY
jgi:hypothetical protein